MTKKHFIALADWMRTEFPYNATEEKQAESMADFCQTQNQRFNRERWLNYVAKGNHTP